MTRPLDNMFDELSGPAQPLGPTDWPEPGSLRRRAEHRRTVRRASIASGVALAAAAVIAVPLTMAGSHHGTVVPAQSVTPVPTAKAAATTTPGTPLKPGAAVPVGDTVQIGTFSLTVPVGWGVRRTTGNYDNPAHVYHRACVAPPATATTRSLYHCAGLDIYYDGFLPGDGTSAYSNDPLHERKSAPAWRHGNARCHLPGDRDDAGRCDNRHLGWTGAVQQPQAG